MVRLAKATDSIHRPVSHAIFRVTVVAQGRNTYAAWVIGGIQQTEDGSCLSALLTLHSVAVVAVVALFAGPGILSWLKGGVASGLWWAVMLVPFHVVMYYVGFRPEAKRAEGALRRIAA